MLGWSLVFFIVAVIAGVFGFGGISESAVGVSQVLFFVFLVLLVLSFVSRAIRGRSVV